MAAGMVEYRNILNPAPRGGPYSGQSPVIQRSCENQKEGDDRGRGLTPWRRWRATSAGGREVSEERKYIERKMGSGIRGSGPRGLERGGWGQRFPKEYGRTRICLYQGGGNPPQEKCANLPDFTPERAHLLLEGVYGEFPHHNNR